MSLEREERPEQQQQRRKQQPQQQQEPSQEERLLSLLEESAPSGGYVSGQALAGRAGISRSAVWKKVRKLERCGYLIESLHGKGYRLLRRTDSPVPWELQKGLRTSFIGRGKGSIIYCEAVDSTQSLAIAIAEKRRRGRGRGDGSVGGTVVIAEQQKSGRGRMKRRWVSPRGGIWLSVVLEPKVPTATSTLLPFVAAVAVCSAIRESTGLDATLKWPNDIMVGGGGKAGSGDGKKKRKVAGILLDLSAEADAINYAVVGIGINANVDAQALSLRIASATTPAPTATTTAAAAGSEPPKTDVARRQMQWAMPVTSLSDELGRETSRLDLARAVLENLERCCLELEKRGGPAKIIAEWKKNSDMLGKRVAVAQQGGGSSGRVLQGVAVDVNDDGSLVVRTDGGEKVTVVSGDVSVRY